MVTLKQINKAINNTVKFALVDTEFVDVEIVSEDTTEALKKRD